MLMAESPSQTSQSLPAVELIVQRALDWALARVGDTSYRGRCYAFVEAALEYGNRIVLDGQGTTATEAARAYGYADSGQPPRGAYVFFDCVGAHAGALQNVGHMGLSLGDGRVVHAWATVAVDSIEVIEQLEPAPGGTSPQYLGWAPIERILQNAAPGEPGTPGPSQVAKKQLGLP